MFHEVTRSSGEHLLESEDYSITLSNFNALLSSLISKDVGFCDIDDVFSGRIPASGKAAVITFDDVFKSVIENALPVLTEKRIPFTVFISECFIDKDGYLSSDDILILRENGLCTIGFHGRSHDKLREVNTVDELLNAVDPSNFEKMYNTQCKYFAYPYGSEYTCPPRVRNVLASTDYAAAFGTVMSGANMNLIKRNIYYIPRININNKNWQEVARQITGSEI